MPIDTVVKIFGKPDGKSHDENGIEVYRWTIIDTHTILGYSSANTLIVKAKDGKVISYMHDSYEIPCE